MMTEMSDVRVEDNDGALEWKNLSFTLSGGVSSTKADAANSVKNILTNCNGRVPKGTVCAVLGPSGAGKSSLLNALAGRVTTDASKGISLTGSVSLGGREIDPVKIRRSIAYVMQDDALDPVATPREALTFNATLKDRAGKTPEEIDEDVEKTLSQLGISECADTYIGGALIKGISGGERKRTSVGCELVTKPDIVFLDEPTSGLDSFSAHQCVSLLKETARASNAIIICTIHQPSSEVFLQFDQAILLKDGQVVYGGAVGKMPEFFEARGFPVPANTNPADHAMFTVQQESLDTLLPQANKIGIDASAKQLGTNVDGDGGKGAVATASTSGATQLKWMLKREGRRIVRDKPALIGRFGVTIFLNLLFGAIFFQAGNGDDNSEQSLRDHFGALTMVAISSMFGSAQPALLAFPVERPIFLREYSGGTYGAFPYFLSKVSVELPMAFTQCLVQWMVVYWLIGFQGNFLLMLLASWALGCAATSVAICIGCVVPDVKQAMEMTPLVFVPQMLFAGFFVRTNQIPVFLRWAQYLCSLKYSLNLLVIVEFPQSRCIKGGEGNAIGCTNLKEGIDLVEDRAWAYILVLAGLFLMFRIMGAYLLAKRAKTVF